MRRPHPRAACPWYLQEPPEPDPILAQPIFHMKVTFCFTITIWLSFILNEHEHIRLCGLCQAYYFYRLGFSAYSGGSELRHLDPTRSDFQKLNRMRLQSIRMDPTTALYKTENSWIGFRILAPTINQRKLNAITRMKILLLTAFLFLIISFRCCIVSVLTRFFIFRQSQPPPKLPTRHYTNTRLFFGSGPTPGVSEDKIVFLLGEIEASSSSSGVHMISAGTPGAGLYISSAAIPVEGYICFIITIRLSY